MMRGKIVLATLILGLSGAAVRAQSEKPRPFPNDVYCSGIITTDSVPHKGYVITGEQSEYQIVFTQGDFVYLSKGSKQGVKVGDVFQLIRPVVDSDRTEWTKWQYALLSKMGTMWEDEAQARVVVTRPDVSIAQLVHSCDFVQRGDIALPFAERPEPPVKSQADFDRFAPPSGKSMAMVVTGKKYISEDGRNDIVYVNLGAHQGVHVGDYFRIFRYTGQNDNYSYLTPRFAFDVEGYLGPTYGLGMAPEKWDWKNTPREDLGEGVVLRTGPNSSTVLITFALREVFSGDYVELE